MRSLVVGTAGHIDHGKSALVKALSGIDPDRLKEEQARGITIDLGFAHLTLGDAAIAFVDVPGHERFVRNMLAGAGGIDAVMLVVAADESLMPQTREHFQICRLLGLRRGLVVVSKSDLVDEETRELVTLELREYLAGSFLESAPIVAASARTGKGLDDVRRALGELAGVAPRQARAGVVRLPVDRVFTVKGFGTVVTGTLVSGHITEADELVVLPERRPVRIRGIQVHGDQAATVSAPRRVALNLGGVDAGELSRGVTLATPDTLAVTRRVDLRLELLSTAGPLAHGARVRLHHGTSEIFGRVSISATRSRPDAPWIVARPGESGVVVPPGGDAYLRARLERSAVLTRGDRTVVRAYSPPVTIGGGLVLDPEPPEGRLRRAGAVERFARLEDSVSAARVWLEEQAEQGFRAADLVRKGGQDAEAATKSLGALIQAGVAVEVAGRAVDARLHARLQQQVFDVLRAFHQTHPGAAGMPRGELRHRIAAGAPPELFDAIIRTLAAAGRIADGERVRLSAHRPPPDAAASEPGRAVLARLEQAGLSPPDQPTLAEAAGLAPAVLKDVVQGLIRERQVVRLDTLVFHAGVLARLREEIRALGGGAAVDVSTFKERFGLSRKYAIPLLEWLDRERVTRRTGNSRLVL